MATDGGSADTLLRCPRDGVDTRLRCAECRTPICPACYVRTAVGLRCQNCAAASGPPLPAAGRRRRGPVIAGIAAVVALIVAGGAWALTRGGGSSADPFEGGTRLQVPQTLLGRGEIPGGFTWILEARRDGRACATLTVSPGPPPREQCNAETAARAIHSTTTQTVPMANGTVYLTLGQASDRTERIRVTEAGAATTELPALGGGTELGVRFFVHHTTANVAVTYAALAADGSELSRFERSALPPPPR